MSQFKTPLTEKLQISLPIIQAPMAGGITTPQLVAEISNAGGLGSLAAGYMEPQQIRAAIVEIRTLTERPFAVNLFAPEHVQEDYARIQRAQELLAPYRDELGLPTETPSEPYLPNFSEQLSVVLDEGVNCLSFTFGLPASEDIETIKEWGITLIATATHLLEAILLEESGVDLIVAQGAEAGGHRATFIGQPEQGLVGTLALLPLLVNHVRVPIVAAGGVMDGRGLAAALALGAAGVQMGTAFLACPESGAHPLYKEKLSQGTEITTSLSRCFSGRLARGLTNRFITEMQAHEAEWPGYPIQNALTRAIRQAAARQNRPEFMSLWAGQGCPLCTTRPAAELVREWAAQALERSNAGH
ncbi:MAG: nitronate monooxygenase [Gammaproteobacteria bacterium]|nr:nitronate monooxygenase [Gammaproteobacteria bacterium]MCP5460070.1 nitronate monooxygenase [Gammaproteobacteria bacterium]